MAVMSLFPYGQVENEFLNALPQVALGTVYQGCIVFAKVVAPANFTVYDFRSQELPLPSTRGAAGRSP